MSISHRVLVLAALLLAGSGWFSPTAYSQEQPAGDSAESAIFKSDRWQRMERDFNEWLSVQTLYSDDEVDAIFAEFQHRMKTMTSKEAESFLKDMEERLSVLLSPEADDARQWLSQFLAAAVNPERVLRRQLPDVANMTASEIRHEIQWLQQHRAARQASHEAGVRGRQLQQELAPERPQPPDRSTWPANNLPPPSQYAPRRREIPPPPLPVIYTVSPWGTPIRFNPLAGRW